MDYRHLVLSVSQINTYIKSIIESDDRLARLVIRGEISNFTNHYRTGHYYMTLKDDSSAIRAVMFKSSNSRLNFIPENGMSVIAFGRISVFERDGQYQLYINDLQPDGAGALSIAFEQLKAKLEKEGLFRQEKKRAIPPFVERIGLITSPTGAAVQDILNVLSRRYPLADVVLAPVLVQGKEAPAQMIAALEEMNQKKASDLIIIGRGGGSLEELWAFNDEELVRAVAASQIPIISAVGHETDFTLCDFAADLRAPTPSAAAELAVPNILDLQLSLEGLHRTLLSQVRTRLSNEKSRLRLLQENHYLKDPLFFINHQRQTLDFLQNTMKNSLALKLSNYLSKTRLLVEKINFLNPEKILSRGYAIASIDGEALRNSSRLSVGDRLKIQLHNGSFFAVVDEFADKEVKSSKERKS